MASEALTQVCEIALHLRLWGNSKRTDTDHLHKYSLETNLQRMYDEIISGQFANLIQQEKEVEPD